MRYLHLFSVESCTECVYLWLSHCQFLPSCRKFVHSGGLR